MTKEEIIKIIVVALISVIAKGFFDKIIAPYIPDTKKLISYILKFLLFILRYGVPIYLLIDALKYDEMSKAFVFKVVCLSIAIALNMVFDLIFYVIGRMLFILEQLTKSTAMSGASQSEINKSILKLIKKIAR